MGDEAMKIQSLFGYQQFRGVIATLSALLLFVLCFSSANSFADPGDIDLFSLGQAQLIDSSPGDGGLSSSVGDGTDMTLLGGARDIYVELLTQDPANPNAKAKLGVGGGALSLSISSLATGTGTVQWDGPDNSIALDPTGLGGIDLTGGGVVSEFDVTTLFSDQGFEFVITAWTDASHWTSISFVSSVVSVPTTSTIDFNGFTTPSLCGAVNPSPGVNSITCAPGDQPADFTNLGALELKIDPSGGTVSVDLTLDSITTKLPRIDIEKATNGVDADDPNSGDAVQILPGDPVTWTYVVTNTGNMPLQNILVTDDQGVSVSCPNTTLDVGESMECTASGYADDLSMTTLTTVPGLCGTTPETPLYENKGKATGQTATGDFVEDEDASHYCNPPVLACRVTGGGVDTDLNWDGTLEDGSMRRGNGASNLPDNIDRYQFGGQAGANTALPPQPKGEWTHHQQSGPSGSFTFHAGTASAPVKTEIDKITCSDPGFCSQARPAPAKQIDFEGIGTFKNLGKGKDAPVWALDENNMPTDIDFTVHVDTGHGNKEYNGTYHWFEVNIDDLGEPHVQNTTPLEACPKLGFGVNGDPTDPLNVEPADCGCPDFYRIKVYNGVYADEFGNIAPDKTHVIYEAYGYIDGGNLQIHPLTGYDSP